ncbi:dsDNA nuclease domain-containing protein [Bacillus proteolyticus]|uniref:dsDNA nuclease domain-containing protein n=1 Tax=Bacillus proteolyticus TaxID=2026192 RepID=UPI003D053F01
MEKREEIMEALKKSEDDLNKDISLVIETKCRDKSKEEIKEYLDILLKEPPKETGGQNAITGFYFQLLCTLYYMAELLEGKWEFLVIELHQDIVVGNQSTVKFIQVKSEVLRERNSVKEVSKTDLYKGWIQKLLSLGRLFPKGSGVNTQFELITNYVIKDSRTVNVEHYLYNNQFGQTVLDSDHILQKVTEYKTRGIDSDFDFEQSCNESIKELLSRFSINPQAINPDKFDDFIGLIGNKFGMLINESAGVSPYDINYLIGELCFECNHTNQGSLLYIDKERAFGYLEILKQRASKNLEDFYANNNNNALIEEIIADLNESYQKLESPLKEQLQDEFETFSVQLKQWANEEIPVIEMIHRYLEGKPFSLSINRLKPLKIKRKAEEIFKTLFVLKILFNDQLKFSKKFKGILIKETQNIYVSILGLDFDQTMEEGLEKLSDILEKATDEEKILLLMQNNHTIFQGEYDDEFTVEEILKVDDVLKQPINPIKPGESIKEVDYMWTIIPGMKFIAILKKARRHKNIDSIKENIRDTWGKLLK